MDLSKSVRLRPTQYFDKYFQKLAAYSVDKNLLMSLLESSAFA